MKSFVVLVALVFPAAAFSQTGGPTPDQLRTLQLQLDEQQQQLNQLKLQQPPTPGQPQPLQSEQSQLNRQQVELQRLQQQQRSCPQPPCR